MIVRPEPAAQVDHRQHRPAQVDHALDEARRHGTWVSSSGTRTISWTLSIGTPNSSLSSRNTTTCSSSSVAFVVVGHACRKSFVIAQAFPRFQAPL
jgi:hypothetical protein